ncbi:MAG: hypothetical protein KY460_06335 [Actinobacteria bacterium]|nr:hypothetical protein [Actinomycetota bacterium]
MTNILICGLHKTGTTGLYDAVKRAVRDNDPPYVFLFEPKSPVPFVALDRYAPQRPILTKILMLQLDSCELDYDRFPRRIMTVRDPRDIAVSRLLFRPLQGRTSYHIDPRRLEPFVAALKEKEADPTSHSVISLHRLATRLGFDGGTWDRVQRQMAQLVRTVDAHDFHLVRYEDFVEGRLDTVSDYLDTELVNARATDIGWLSHIPRSMGYGEWRHWFLEEDDRFFGELFGDFMQRFGYDDWSRPQTQVIDPTTSSDYVSGKVARLIGERQERQRKWSVDWVTEPAQVTELRSMAEDGRATWAYRLALVLSRGVVDRDVPGAIHWAREAAVLGHRAAVGVLIDLLAGHRADDPVAQGERRFWELEQRRRAAEAKVETETADELEQLRRELRARERELVRIRRSTAFRAASLVGALVRSRRAAIPRIVRVVRRWVRR